MPRFTPFLGPLALTLVLAAGASDAFASGGSIVGKNDGVGSFDGFCSGYASSGAVQEYVARFNPGELDPTSIGFPVSTIICGSHLWVYNFDGALTFHGACFLRPEDPANPGYPDLTVTLGDDPAAGVYPPGYSDSFAVFGGGAGVAVDGTASLFLCWQQPPDQPLGLANHCVMMDTTNPAGSSNDSLNVDSGFLGYLINADWQMDMTVFQDDPVNTRVSAHGKQRFPGDKGNSIVYSRRPNSGPNVSDDLVAFTMVIDNNTGSPFSSTLKIEADRGRAQPPLGKGFKDITAFFVPKIASPIVLPVGRTVLNGRLKTTIPPAYLGLMPIQLPGRFSLSASGSGAIADTEYDTWGLRNYVGQYDAGTDDVSLLVNVPAQPGDVLAVQFPAIDLPSTADYIISGVSVVGSEFGGTGLAGYDYIELREEDPILTAPNESPSGLMRAVGLNDGVGEISVGGGGPATEVVVDFVDINIPVTNPAFTTVNYWVKVGIRPGDDFTNGTAVVMDNRSATRQPNTYFVDGLVGGTYNRISFFGTQNYNGEVRLQLDGQLGTLPGGSSSVGRTPPVQVHSRSMPARLDVSVGRD